MTNRSIAIGTIPAECSKLADEFEQKHTFACIEMKESMELKHKLEMSTVQMNHAFEMKKLQNTMQMRRTKEMLNLKAEYEMKQQMESNSEAYETKLQNYRAAMDMKYNQELATIKQDYQSNLIQMQMNVEQMKAEWTQAAEDHQSKMSALQEAYERTKAELEKLTEEYVKVTQFNGHRQRRDINRAMEIKRMEFRQMETKGSSSINALFVHQQIRVETIETSNDNESILIKEFQSADELENVKIVSNIFHMDGDETASNYDANLFNISVSESPEKSSVTQTLKGHQTETATNDGLRSHCNEPTLQHFNPIEPNPVVERLRRCQYNGCLREFSDHESLEKHLRIHAALRPVKCRACGLLFTDESNMKEHMKTHGAYPFKCSIDGCGKQFKNESKLTRHIWDHEGKERPWKCTNDNCKQRFFTKSSFDRHMATHTQATALPQKIEKKQKFRCDFIKCDYVAEQQKELIRHRRKHSGADPWPCEYLNCGKVFAHQGHLIRHLKTH